MLLSHSKIFAILSLLFATTLLAQAPSNIRYGAKTPPEVRTIYRRGLAYLAASQKEAGNWNASGYSHGGPGEHGITGICVMAFLASGEDPNFGKYSQNIRRALRNMILGQNPETGYLGGSMYHHGFAMLSLSEAYGAVDDSRLWEGGEPKERKRTIGEALELAVRMAVTSQKKNKLGGWRYSPQDTQADTSVSGAVLMGLLAARNAGIEVPNESIERALGYFRSCTSEKGMVAYTSSIEGFGASMNRSSIATLVYAVGKKKDWPEYAAALGYIKKNLGQQNSGYPFYFRYYVSQALFQGDFEAWKTWNRQAIRRLQALQQEDGGFNGGHGGKDYSTAMALLALALNHRFLPIYER